MNLDKKSYSKFSLDPAFSSNKDMQSINISAAEKAALRLELNIKKLINNDELIKPEIDPLDYVDGYIYTDGNECRKESLRAFWIQRAFNYIESGQSDEAISAYNSAIAINSSNKYIWYNLGILYANMHEYISALKSYDRALKLDFPDIKPSLNAEIWLHKGLIYFNIGAYDCAVMCLENAETLGRDDVMIPEVDLYRFLGYALYMTGAFKKALDCYNKINFLNRDNENPVDWCNRGIILQKLKKSAKAEKAFVKAIKLGIKIPKKKLL